MAGQLNKHNWLDKSLNRSKANKQTSASIFPLSSLALHLILLNGPLKFLPLHTNMHKYAHVCVRAHTRTHTHTHILLSSCSSHHHHSKWHSATRLANKFPKTWSHTHKSVQKCNTSSKSMAHSDKTSWHVYSSATKVKICVFLELYVKHLFYTHTHTHSHTRSHTHSHTHTRMHTHTHTCTCTHTYTHSHIHKYHIQPQKTSMPNHQSVDSSHDCQVLPRDAKRTHSHNLSKRSKKWRCEQCETIQPVYYFSASCTESYSTQSRNCSTSFPHWTCM